MTNLNRYHQQVRKLFCQLISYFTFLSLNMIIPPNYKPLINLIDLIFVLFIQDTKHVILSFLFILLSPSSHLFYLVLLLFSIFSIQINYTFIIFIHTLIYI